MRRGELELLHYLTQAGNLELDPVLRAVLCGHFLHRKSSSLPSASLGVCSVQSQEGEDQSGSRTL